VSSCARNESPTSNPSPTASQAPEIDAVGTIREFTFPGGRFQDGQVIVASDAEVAQDPESKSVMLRMAGGGIGTEIDCNCTSGTGGSCFPVTQDDPLGGILVLCASIDPCNDCEQVITVPGSFSLRASCKRVARAANP
jgi:hypothetical protein